MHSFNGVSHDPEGKSEKRVGVIENKQDLEGKSVGKKVGEKKKEVDGSGGLKSFCGSI